MTKNQIRKTSLDAYVDYQDKIPKSQKDVYGAIEELNTELNGCTNLEIATHLRKPINTVTPRTNELVKAGKVFATGKRKCTVSGKTAITWGIVYK